MPAEWEPHEATWFTWPRPDGISFPGKYDTVPPVYAALNAFGNALVFAQAIEMTKTTEPKALIKALETGSFKGWSAVPVTFPQAEGSLWHNWSPPLMILKYTKEGQTQSDAEVAYTLGDK